MNSNSELDANLRSRKLQEKNRKDAKVIIRYVLFFLSIIFFLSLFSFLGDLYYLGIQGKTSFGYYVIIYSVYSIPLSPLIIIYNIFINNLINNHFARILFGIIVSFYFGWLLSKNFNFGLYIGQYVKTKNIMTVCLTGVSIELLRYFIVRYRNQKRRDNPESKSIFY